MIMLVISLICMGEIMRGAHIMHDGGKFLQKGRVVYP